MLMLGAVATATAEEFFFKPNDRVLFLGDSITEQYQYSTDIELYLTTRFPRGNMTFINAGISGDTAQGGKNRFKDHVLAEQPTVMTINFGMNDGGYGNFDPNRQKQFLEGTEAMLTMARAAGIRVGLVSPNAVDPRVQERFKLYLETQKEFYAPLKDLAAKHGFRFADQYATTRSALEKMAADKSPVIPFGDGFHTSPNGGLFMAHAILTGLNAPSLVSHVGIDRNSFGPGAGSKVQGCNISGEKKTETGVEFDRLDQALPLPIQNDWVSLLPYVNNLQDLNRYELAVSGLAAGKYAVLIDGVEVATHSAEELANGVNLGNVTKGPVYDQGQKVFQAINHKNGMVHQRFRGVVMFNAPDWLADIAAERKPKELAKRTEQIAAQQAEVYKLAQPVKRHFEIVPAK
ncbi:MAG: SGNH/GDSL hydrolase family protein [Planctomycetes bacterium]|nr:SGNH/GDSL hydrolase family protein [Planctomycetota bacterium]